MLSEILFYAIFIVAVVACIPVGQWIGNRIADRLSL